MLMLYIEFVQIKQPNKGKNGSKTNAQASQNKVPKLCVLQLSKYIIIVHEHETSCSPIDKNFMYLKKIKNNTLNNIGIVRNGRKKVY